MKKIKFYLAAVLIAGLSFTSCSDDDDNGSSTDGEIVAKWTPTRTVNTVNNVEVSSTDYTFNEPGCEKDFTQFLAGGVLNDVIYYKNAAEVCTQDADVTGTWTKSGNTLVIDDANYEITRLTGSELVYKSTVTTSGATLVVTEYFSKVN